MSAWAHDPAFTVLTLQRLVHTTHQKVTCNDLIWQWVNAGVGNYGFVAEGMAFPQFYDAKTKPGGGRGSGERFGPLIRTDEIVSRGIAARDFAGQVLTNHKEELFDVIQGVLNG